MKLKMFRIKIYMFELFAYNAEVNQNNLILCLFFIALTHARFMLPRSFLEATEENTISSTKFYITRAHGEVYHTRVYWNVNHWYVLDYIFSHHIYKVSSGSIMVMRLFYFFLKLNLLTIENATQVLITY